MICENRVCRKETGTKYRYCNVKCNYTENNARNKKPERRIICANDDCKKEITTRQVKQRFCSRECLLVVKHPGIKNLDRTLQVACANSECTNTFTRTGIGCTVKKFCSPQCNQDHKNRGAWAKLSEEKREQYRKSDKIKLWQLSPHGRYRRLCNQAKTRSLDVLISEEEYIKLIERMQCFYCSEPLGTGTGIDRYDHNIGYVLENCRPCCWPCNEIKGGLERWLPLHRCIELLPEARRFQ